MQNYCSLWLPPLTTEFSSITRTETSFRIFRIATTLPYIFRSFRLSTLGKYIAPKPDNHRNITETQDFHYASFTSGCETDNDCAAGEITSSHTIPSLRRSPSRASGDSKSLLRPKGMHRAWCIIYRCDAVRI